MEQAMRIGIWVEWELRQGEAWPSFGVCEGVFISFKLFSPADGHPWQRSLRMDPGNPGNPGNTMMNFIKHCFFNEFFSYLYVTDALQVWLPIIENYTDQG